MQKWLCFPTAQNMREEGCIYEKTAWMQTDPVSASGCGHGAWVLPGHRCPRGGYGENTLSETWCVDF